VDGETEPSVITRLAGQGPAPWHPSKASRADPGIVIRLWKNPAPTQCCPEPVPRVYREEGSSSSCAVAEPALHVAAQPPGKGMLSAPLQSHTRCDGVCTGKRTSTPLSSKS